MRQLSRRAAVGFELLVRRAKRAKQEFTAQLPHSRRASRRERAREERVFRDSLDANVGFHSRHFKYLAKRNIVIRHLLQFKSVSFFKINRKVL